MQLFKPDYAMSLKDFMKNVKAELKESSDNHSAYYEFDFEKEQSFKKLGKSALRFEWTEITEPKLYAIQEVYEKSSPENSAQNSGAEQGFTEEIHQIEEKSGKTKSMKRPYRNLRRDASEKTTTSELEQGKKKIKKMDEKSEETVKLKGGCDK